MVRAKQAGAAVVLVALLASVVACDADNESAKSTPQSNDRICKDLIGQSAVDQVKVSAKLSGKGAEYSGYDLGKVKSQFEARAWLWSPENEKDDDFLLFSLDDVCRIYPKGMSKADLHVQIKYGASSTPFSDLNRREIGPRSKVIDVNSDVKLVLWEYKHSRREQSVYVKCKVRDAVPQQEAGLPIQGTIIDTLTHERDDTHRLTYLLRSAGVVAKVFGCLNKPTVPTELPAGWSSSSD